MNRGPVLEHLQDLASPAGDAVAEQFWQCPSWSTGNQDMTRIMFEMGLIPVAPMVVTDSLVQFGAIVKVAWA